VIGLTDPAQKLILRKRLILKIIMGLFLKINFSQVGQRGRWANDKQDHCESAGRVYVAANSPVIFACRRSYPWCGGLGQGGFAGRSQPRVDELAEIASGNLLVTRLGNPGWSRSNRCSAPARTGSGEERRIADLKPWACTGRHTGHRSACLPPTTSWHLDHVGGRMPRPQFDRAQLKLLHLAAYVPAQSWLQELGPSLQGNVAGYGESCPAGNRPKLVPEQRAVVAFVFP
jgi:hypothetical protein